MLSICCNAGFLGAAWTCAADDTVYVLSEDTDIDNVSQILERTEGGVMGSVRVPAQVIDLIRICNREFVMHSNKEYALSIYVPASARTEHNELSQRAVNAMIKTGSVQPIAGELVLVNIGEHLHVSMQVLQNLEIVEFMDHPNPHFGKTMSSKCLVSLLNSAKSVGGKALVKKWLCYPLFDQAAIVKRQREVQIFCGNPGLIESVQTAMRGVKNVQHVLAKLQTDNKCDHLKSIIKFMESALEVQSVLAGTPLSGKISLVNRDDWTLIVATVGRIVDFERSQLEGERVIIKYGVDGHLDELRDLYSMLPEKLSAVAIEIGQVVKTRESSTVRALNVVYFPQLGYLTAAPVLHQYELLGLFPDWELVFTTDKIAYFKNPWMRQLDEQLGDVHANIVDCEIEIFEQIRQSLLEMRCQLDVCYKEVCELDCLAALAQSTLLLDLNPTLFGTDSVDLHNSFDIKESRHIIAEHCCSFIPNDFSMSKEKPIVVITGPNASGKSVLMKQIGLHVLTSQAFGFAAVGPESRLPMIKNIYTRIRAVESAGRLKSAFALEIEQLKAALEGCDADSLLLIDEFGKGTLPEDGIALLTATIEYIAQMEHPPWCLIVTHFTEIVGLLKDTVKEKVNWLQMNIYENQQDNPVFLFKAVEGVCQRSLGVHCAKRAGIQSSILDDASDIAVKLMAGIPTRDLAWAAVPEEQEQLMAALIRDTLTPHEE